jgi:predicted O-linked N-acetylglucosamine transferase (SPINDLY family)
MGMTELITDDVDSYVRLAVQLGTDADRRADVKKRLRETSGVLFDDVGIVRELERFFLSAVSH